MTDANFKLELDRWLTSGAICAAAPLDGICSATRVAGRRRIEPDVVERLAAAHEMHGAHGCVVADVLWSVLDVHEDRLSYESYIGARILAPTAGVAAASALLIREALLDEIDVDLDAAVVGGERHSAQARRIHALSRYLDAVLGRGQDDPGRTDVDPVSHARAVLADMDAHERLVHLEPDHRVRMRVAALPMTEVRDERLFLRVVQALEMSFGSWTHLVLEACDGAAAGRAADVVSLVDRVSVEMSTSRRLLGALSTLTVADFATIRGATDGASAISSKGYQALNRRCSGSDGLDEAVRAMEEGAGDRPATSALQRLDEAHRRWKRLHAGVAHQLIGDRPGTGGTTGVGHLRQAIDRPLFPLAASGR